MKRAKPPTKRVLDILNEIEPAADIPHNLPPHEAAMFAEPQEEPHHGPLPRCRTSGKLCYPSQRTATLAVRKIQRKRNHWLRTYFCPDCKAFHLSSAKPK